MSSEAKNTAFGSYGGGYSKIEESYHLGICIGVSDYRELPEEHSLWGRFGEVDPDAPLIHSPKQEVGGLGFRVLGV